MAYSDICDANGEVQIDFIRRLMCSRPSTSEFKANNAAYHVRMVIHARQMMLLFTNKIKKVPTEVMKMFPDLPEEDVANVVSKHRPTEAKVLTFIL